MLLADDGSLNLGGGSRVRSGQFKVYLEGKISGNWWSDMVIN